MTNNNTIKDLKVKVKKILDSKLLMNLRGRWEDERKYENMSEYNKIIEKEFDIKLTSKITKSKFEFVTEFSDGSFFKVKVNLGSIRHWSTNKELLC